MTIGIYRNMSNVIKINKLIGLFLGTFKKESHVYILIQNTKKDNYLYILALIHPKNITIYMDKKTLSILKKVYSNENGFYNLPLKRHEHKIPATVTQTDLDVLSSIGLPPNNFETFDHDNALERLLKLKEDKKLTSDFVTSLFLKGLTGEMPRARQTLMSYLYLRHLYKHDFAGKDTCEICGLPKNETKDRTHQRYTYYLGHSWNELPLHYLVELEEALTFNKPETTKANPIIRLHCTGRQKRNSGEIRTAHRFTQNIRPNRQI